MSNLVTPEVLKIVQDALQKEFGVELTVEIKKDGFSVELPKKTGLVFKLPVIIKRMNEILHDEERKLFFQRDCLVYSICTDTKGRKVVMQDVGHQLLSDLTLTERAHTKFNTAKQGYIKIGFKKVYLDVLSEVRIARSKEQSDEIEAAIVKDQTRR